MRIGLLLNILNEEYQISVFKGIKRKAAELGVQIVCFQQENTTFAPDSFAGKISSDNYFDLDGLILLSSVMIDGYELKTVNDVKALWGDIPVVSVGQKIEGVPSLLIQTDESMKQLVEHLILAHKYRKLLFISGSEHHYDAIMREKIMMQTLEAYKPWFPELECTLKRGWFIEGDAIKIMTEYYEENNESPDVVVCANDNMAIGVYKFFSMHRNDPRIKECAVTGFDDIPQGRFVIPALTTIRQPLLEIGQKALETMVDLIKTKKTQELYYIESEMVVRQSCGCKNSEKNNELPHLKYYEDIQANYIQAEQMLRLVTHFGQNLNKGQDENSIKHIVNNYMEQLQVKNFCLLKFDEPVLLHSANAEPTVTPVYVRRNDSFLHSFKENQQLLISEFFRAYMEYDKNQPESLVFKFLSVGTEIIGCAIYDATDEVLPHLCSICVNIGQTMNRIELFEEKKRRSEYLEQEVNKRTKELIEANNRRMEVEAEVLKISEIERQRFSQDLHDDICQRLAGISMLCRSYSNSPNPIQKEEMVELAGLISDTLTTTRQYAHNSYPVELESLGLNHSIGNLCNSFENQVGIKCKYQWKVSDDENFTNLQKLNIFRIIQEAIHNVHKHSKATEVEVLVKDGDNKNTTVVLISDNGCGLKDSKVKTGLGLNSMQYRANQIDATFRIYENKPQGTCVEVVLKRD